MMFNGWTFLAVVAICITVYSIAELAPFCH
jgi:hypothetical protein